MNEMIERFGTDHAKVTFIEGEDGSDVEALGSNYDGGIGEAEL